MSTSIDLLDTTTYAPKKAAPSRVRRLAQRGMTTAEYAVGILGAVAFALILLKVFTNNAVAGELVKYILKLIKFFATKMP